MRFTTHIVLLFLSASTISGSWFRPFPKQPERGPPVNNPATIHKPRPRPKTEAPQGDSPQTTGEPTLDVASVISVWYTETLTLAPAVSTRLASAINAIQTSWHDTPEHASIESAINSAASKAPDSIQSTILGTGSYIDHDAIKTADWYVTAVPPVLQEALAALYDSVSAAEESITGTQFDTPAQPTASSTGIDYVSNAGLASDGSVSNDETRVAVSVGIAGFLGLLGAILAGF